MEIVQSKPLYIQVYEMIRELILTGEILPDEQINEVRLARDLEVSRGPIREAIRQLEKEGLLVRKNNSLYVYKTSKEDLQHIYEVRTSLESLAVSISTENLTDEVIAKFHEVFIEKEKLLKEDALKDISMPFSIECTKFHNLILENCGNPRLTQQINHLRSLTRFYMNSKLRKSDRREQTYYEHKAVFEAMLHGDVKEASELMKYHMKNDLVYLVNWF